MSPRREHSASDSAEARSSTYAVGSHVVAPCPHDGRCPMLLFPTSASPASVKPNPHARPNAREPQDQQPQPLSVCSFSQRLQRPTFLRRTKHAGKGHEDIKYSYVVIRRGDRPGTLEGAVVNAALAKEKAPKVSRREKRRERAALREVASSVEGQASDEITLEFDFLSVPSTLAVDEASLRFDSLPPATLDPDTTRLQSFYWPRIIASPMKRSGHVVLDTCTKEGKP